MFSGRCTKSSECSQNEQGFCNMQFGSSGYCLKCRDIAESCDNDFSVQSSSLEDCKKTCEGIHKSKKCHLTALS